MKKLFVVLLVGLLLVGLSAGVLANENDTGEESSYFESMMDLNTKQIVAREYNKEKVNVDMNSTYSFFIPGLGLFNIGESSLGVKHLTAGIGVGVATGLVNSQTYNSSVRTGTFLATLAVHGYSAFVTRNKTIEYNENILAELRDEYNLSLNIAPNEVGIAYNF